MVDALIKTINASAANGEVATSNQEIRVLRPDTLDQPKDDCLRC